MISRHLYSQKQKIFLVHSQTNVVLPLLTWTLKQEELVVQPLAVVVADILSWPETQTLTNESIIWAVSEFLKSDEARLIAKEGLSHLIEEVSQTGTTIEGHDAVMPPKIPPVSNEHA